MEMLWLLVVTWLLDVKSGVSAGSVEPIKDIHMAALFPMSGAWRGGMSTLRTTQYALEYINNRSDVLPGYRLNLHWADSKCDPGLGVHRMYELLNAPPAKLIVYGGVCSKVTQPMAESSHYWNNLLQLSYASTSPALSNKVRYPRFFRIASSDVMMNPARIELCRHFGWARVATITESHELFTMVAEDSYRLFTEHNITLVTAELVTDDPAQQVSNLKKHDARIIFAGAYEPMALKIICEAYKIGLYGSSVVWIFPRWYTMTWWKDKSSAQEQSGCYPEELMKAAAGAFHTGVPPYSLDPPDTMTVYGNTYGEYLEAMHVYEKNWANLYGTIITGQVFDGVFIIALALNMTINDLWVTGSNKSLDAYEYDLEINNLIYKNMWNVRFQGYKGMIYFNENGEHPGKVQITRIQNDERYGIGVFDPVSGMITWNKVKPLVWEGGAPPADATTLVLEPTLVTPLVYAVMVIVAILGILTGFGFIGFNIKFRHARVIKMSSPLVNNIIVLGCMLCYSTVFWRELDPNSTLAMCQVRTFTLMVGFSTAFGALFAKTWRVHRIFSSKLNKVVMKDSRLVLMIAAIAAFDIILCIVFTLIDPQRVEVINTESMFEDNGNTLRQRQVYLCTSSMSVYFQGIVYSTKGLLLIFGTFLAWETRKVTIPALNDSQYIGICIYNVVVLSIMGVVLAYVLVVKVTLQYVLTSAILIFGTTITQAIIFVPKMIKIRDGTAEEDTKTSIGAANAVQPTETTTIHPEMQTNLDKASKQVLQLQEELEEKNKQIAELTKDK